MQGEGGARLSTSEPPQPQPLTSSPGPATSPRSRPSRTLVLLLASCAAVVYAADQVTKVWAVGALTDRPPRPLLGTFLQFDLVRNPGAAFSLGTGSTWLLTALAVLVLVGIVRTSRRLGSMGWAVAFGLVLGGALGNLTDRFLRFPGAGRGHVVDFLDYNGWFVGNVADIAIVSAAVLIGVQAVRGVGVDGRREGRS